MTGGSDEVTGDHVSAARVAELGLFPAALLDGYGAAGMEGAAPGGIDRARHVAL